jgi:hypothetical protein
MMSCNRLIFGRVFNNAIYQHLSNKIPNIIALNSKTQWRI